MTSPVTAPGGTIATTPPVTIRPPAQPNGQLSSDAFLKLLVAQLQYQDPSQPADTTALMNQTATLNQIQSIQELTTATDQLLKNSQQQQATSLVGRTVGYTDSAGVARTGVVGAVDLAGAAPVLTVGTDHVGLSSVTSVTTGSSA